MTAYYRSLPDEVVEAAIIDGAHHFGVFRRIALPMSGPALVTIAVLQFIQIWDDLLVGLLFLQNQSERTITVGLGTLASGRVTNIPGADGRIADQRDPGDARVPDLPALPHQRPHGRHQQMSSFEVVDPAGIELGEHPIWDPDSGRVGWVDVFAGELRWVGGEDVELLAASRRRWGPWPCAESGGVVAAAGDGIHFRDADGRADREPITGFLPAWRSLQRRRLRPVGQLPVRDGVAARRARAAAASTACVPTARSRPSPRASPNPTAWRGRTTARTLYYVDSGEPVVRRYRLPTPTRSPQRGEDLCSVPDGQGVPDGLCIDADGARVGRHLGGRRAVARLATRASCWRWSTRRSAGPPARAFGGPDLDRLFVATPGRAWTNPQRTRRALGRASAGVRTTGARAAAVPAFAG